MSHGNNSNSLDRGDLSVPEALSTVIIVDSVFKRNHHIVRTVDSCKDPAELEISMKKKTETSSDIFTAD